MPKVEVTLNWLSDKPISPEDLSGFFNEPCGEDGKGDKGSKRGIYFWIHNGKCQRIAYIGETGKGDESFRTRTDKHLKIFNAGEYSAVNCGDDGDLFDFYGCHTKFYDCPNKKPDYCPCKSVECQYFKPYLEKDINRLTKTEQIANTQRGKNINAKYIGKMSFIFAAISDIRLDGRSGIADQTKLRKEIEGLLMLQMLQCVMQEEQKKAGTRNVKDFYVNRGFLWGHIEACPEGDYTIKNQNLCPAIAKIMKDELGLSEPTWHFPATEIARLKAQVK